MQSLNIGKFPPFTAFAILAANFLFSGCAFQPGSHTDSLLKPRTTRITWFGNQCFQITSSLGTSILINPYKPGSHSLNLPHPFKPDVLLITNENPQANNEDAVQNTPVVFRSSIALGRNNYAGITFVGIPSTAPDGSLNIIFSWMLDEIKFCFLGHLATLPAPTYLHQIGRCDALFLPTSTGLSRSDISSLINALKPRIIIPIGPRQTITKSTSFLPNPHHFSTPTLLINQHALPQHPVTIILPSK